MHKRLIVIGCVFMEMCMVLGILNYIYNDKKVVKPVMGSRKETIKKNLVYNKNVAVTQNKVDFSKAMKPAKPAKHTFSVDTAADSKQFYASMERLGVVIK